MAGRVIWRCRAEEDLTEAYAHLGAESPTAAERLLDAVEEAIELLLENPRAGRRRAFCSPRAQEVRSWILKDFESYLLFYRSDGEDLEVVRFLHGARDLPALLDDES
ncbi:MAG: type II toxin-antitoxin system RelE/ParE family toxin [Planctomycetota bacterium]